MIEVLVLDELDIIEPTDLVRYCQANPHLEQFDNIPRLVRTAMASPYWEQAPDSRRRSLFLGQAA